MHITKKITLRAGAGLRHLSAVLAVLFLSVIPAMAADIGLIEPAALSGTTVKWVILDARPRERWEAGHIPGALSFPWETFTKTDEKGVKYSSLPPQELAAVLAGLGIDEKSPLLIYGDADTSWGGEGYAAWLFSWLGHKGPIRLLDGGIQRWRSRNLLLDKGAEKPLPRKARYRVDLKSRYIVSTEELQKNRDGYVLVDVRSTFEWLKGKIPGAIHIPWEDFYSGKDRRPLSPTELKNLLAKKGVDTGKPVVFYCLGGVRSAYAWTVYQLAGLPDGRNYKGSWAAWEKRSGQ